MKKCINKNEEYSRAIDRTTKQVFVKQNQVYLKKGIETISGEDIEWCPINFYWAPLIQLQRDLSEQEIHDKL